MNALNSVAIDGTDIEGVFTCREVGVGCPAESSDIVPLLFKSL